MISHSYFDLYLLRGEIKRLVRNVDTVFKQMFNRGLGESGKTRNSQIPLELTTD